MPCAGAGLSVIARWIGPPEAPRPIPNPCRERPCVCEDLCVEWAVLGSMWPGPFAIGPSGAVITHTQEEEDTARVV